MDPFLARTFEIYGMKDDIDDMENDMKNDMKDIVEERDEFEEKSLKLSLTLSSTIRKKTGESKLLIDKLKSDIARLESEVEQYEKKEAKDSHTLSIITNTKKKISDSIDIPHDRILFDRQTNLFSLILSKDNDFKTVGIPVYCNACRKYKTSTIVGYFWSSGFYKPTDKSCKGCIGELSTISKRVMGDINYCFCVKRCVDHCIIHNRSKRSALPFSASSMVSAPSGESLPRLYHTKPKSLSSRRHMRDDGDRKPKSSSSSSSSSSFSSKLKKSSIFDEFGQPLFYYDNE